MSRSATHPIPLHIPFRGRSLPKALGCVERLDENVQRLLTALNDLPDTHVERNVVVAIFRVEDPVQLAPSDEPFIRQLANLYWLDEHLLGIAFQREWLLVNDAEQRLGNLLVDDGSRRPQQPLLQP